MILKIIQKLLLLILIMSFGIVVHAQRFHDLSIMNLVDNSIAPNKLQGKKIMVIILDGTRMDTALIKQLIVFERKYKSAVKVVGLLSFEDIYGHSSSYHLLRKIKKWLPNMVFIQGLYTGKGSKETPVVKWLTKKEQNRHFAQQIKGIGQKFFIDETGELYAVLGPEVPLDSKLIARVVRRN